MIKSFVFSDLKTWIEWFVFTFILVIIGMNQFQDYWSLPSFILLLTGINWITFGFVNLIFHRLVLNKTPWQIALKPFIFGLFSALSSFFILRINTEFTLAFFSAFLLLGFVWSAFEYLFFVFEELQHVNNTRPLSLETEKNTDYNQLFNLISGKNRTKFNLKWAQIICFESDDNYITIYYLENDQTKKRVERLAMRTIQQEIEQQSLPFIRVHKSYMVNRNFIQQVSGKAQNYKLKIEAMEFEVPVSRRLNIHEILANN